MTASNRNKWLLIAIIMIAASMAIVNATVFAYRYLSGSVNAVASTGLNADQAAALGAACSGFYIKGAPSGNTISNDTVLPDGGTNNNNVINTGTAWLGVKVDFTNSEPACQWSDNSGTNTLYESATVYLNVSTGTWYIKDFLAFGYPHIKDTMPSPIYVTIKPTTVLNDPNIAEARLLIYKNNVLERTIDLTSSSSSEPVQLNPGDGLQLDLELRATGTVSNAAFNVGFYVATTNEQPR